MPIPQNIREISQNIDASVLNDRIELAEYLASIESDDELYLRCVRKAVKAATRYRPEDRIWLVKWLPVIMKKEMQNEEN